jgi:hypothetical protein
MQIYGEKMGKKPGEIKAMTYRPPVRPIPIEVLATGVEAMDLGLEYQIEGEERELIEEREEAIENNSNFSDGDAKVGQGKEVVEIIFENPRRQR